MFDEEIDYIEDRKLRKLAKRLVEGMPSYFFDIPASSSGKYHPQYALGEGGLYRHTKAAVRIAISLLNLEQHAGLPKDHIIIALIVHDAFKQGAERTDRTVTEHPWLSSNYVRNFDYKNKNDLSLIASLIESHMGQWTGDILPKPETDAQKFVHLCDYIASRKFIEVTTEGEID